MYHKVDIIAPTLWWVTPEDLDRQLHALKGRKFVYLDDYNSPETKAVITFDDAYENAARHAFPVLAAHGVPFEVFVIGGSIGGWNDFDPGEPRTRHMDLNHLEDAVRCGGRLQWHTRSHPDLAALDDSEIANEMTLPQDLRQRFPPPHFNWFSYPGGSHDQRCIEAARGRFTGAVSVIAGTPGDRWQINRVTVDRHTSFGTHNLARYGIPPQSK